MFILIKFRTSMKMGHVGSKTKSLGKILEKSCVRSRGHIVSTTIMNLGQNVCPDENMHEFENEPIQVKN